MDEGLSQSALRTVLIIAAAAALVILAGLFSDGVRYGCIAVVALAALFTAGERHRRGGGWWTLVGIGAGLSIAGALVALAVNGLGGLIAVVGGSLVVIGCVVGFPNDTIEPGEAQP